MPQTDRKTLSFPLAGVDRQGVYRRQTRPYAAPWASNVRGYDPLEGRERGGSRPGLSKISSSDLGDITLLVSLTYIDPDGARHADLVAIGDGQFYVISGSVSTATTGELATEAGATLATEAGDLIVFDSTVSAEPAVGTSGAYSAAARGGKLYLADSVLRVYSPSSGVVEPVLASAGTVPTEQPLVCTYRDRIVLAGSDHVWYASRQSDPSDWDFGADMDDNGRAVAGQVAFSGGIGDAITAMVPVEDRALVFASENELWVLSGDPASGQLSQVSSEIGIIASQAWAVSPGGLVAFLSNDGVFLWGAGSGRHPERFSEDRMPEQLRNVSTSSRISMAYDPTGRGYHLSITPSEGTGTHWWLDIPNRAIWPVSYQAGHQPTAMARVDGNGLAETAMAGRDGYVRKPDRSSATDDGSTLESHVLLGPIRLTADDTHDAALAELHGILAAGTTGTVTWRLCMGDSAEAVTDTAVAGVLAAIAGTAISGVVASGAWTAGRNPVVRPRSRGAWMVVWLEGAGKWAYEAVAMVSRRFGRIRP